MKAVPLRDAPNRLRELFAEAQSGSPVLLVSEGQAVKLERIEPPDFGGNIATLEGMLLDAVRSPHSEWTAADLDDIASRVRDRRSR